MLLAIVGSISDFVVLRVTHDYVIIVIVTVFAIVEMILGIPVIIISDKQQCANIEIISVSYLYQVHCGIYAVVQASCEYSII